MIGNVYENIIICDLYSNIHKNEQKTWMSQWWDCQLPLLSSTKKLLLFLWATKFSKLSWKTKPIIRPIHDIHSQYSGKPLGKQPKSLDIVWSSNLANLFFIGMNHSSFVGKKFFFSIHYVPLIFLTNSWGWSLEYCSVGPVSTHTTQCALNLSFYFV